MLTKVLEAPGDGCSRYSKRIRTVAVKSLARGEKLSTTLPTSRLSTSSLTYS